MKDLYRYQIVNADNQILRFITVSGNVTERHAAIKGKLEHLYGTRSCFLRVELVSESYFKKVAQMFKYDKGNTMIGTVA